MRRLVLALAAFVALPAYAQTPPANCLPHDDMRGFLGRGWSEGRTSEALGLVTGTTGGPLVFEVWSNATTGSWTLTTTSPDGMACIVASGIAWSAVDDAPANASEQRS